MSQENFEQLMGAVMEGMAWKLMDLGSNESGAKDIETCVSGDLVHLRVKNKKGEVTLQVAGKDPGDLAYQMVLACLHNISIERLCAMHNRPLKRPLQAVKGNE